MIKHRYFAGRVLVYGLISVAVMLSAAVTGCNNKNNISEGSIKTEAVQPEGNNQSEEGSESDVNEQSSDIHVEPPVIHGISDKTYYIGSKVSYMTDVYATDFSGQEIDVEVDKSQVNTSQPGRSGCTLRYDNRFSLQCSFSYCTVFHYRLYCIIIR